MKDGQTPVWLEQMKQAAQSSAHLGPGILAPPCGPVGSNQY